MIGTGMCLGIGWLDLGYKIFHIRCLGMGTYSVWIVLDFVFFFFFINRFYEMCLNIVFEMDFGITEIFYRWRAVLKTCICNYMNH